MSEKEYSGGKVNYYEVEVNHPTREGREPYTAECNDVIETLGLSFAEGEAFKAIWRKGAARLFPGKKGHDSGLYDAEKAHFYGNRMEVIERYAIGKAMRDEDQAMPAEFGQQHTFEPATHNHVTHASLVDIAPDESCKVANDMADDSERMQAIGQNGNDGEHYDAIDIGALRAAAPQDATHYLSIENVPITFYKKEKGIWFAAGVHPDEKWISSGLITSEASRHFADLIKL